MGADVSISREQIEHAFAALADRLAARREPAPQATVHMFGDAAMMFAHGTRDGVRSVQAILSPRAVLLAEVSRVAASVGLPPAWLNDRGRGSVPASYEFAASVVWQHDALRVLVVGAEELLAMKVLAPIEVADAADIRALATGLGIGSLAEIDVLLADVMPGQSLGKLARQSVDSIIG